MFSSTYHWSYTFFPLVLHPIGPMAHWSYLSLVLRLVDPNHIHAIHDSKCIYFYQEFVFVLSSHQCKISGHTHEFNGLGSPDLVESILLPVPMMKPRMRFVLLPYVPYLPYMLEEASIETRVARSFYAGPLFP